MIALPVIDAQDRLVGIITHDDALDVMEAEATEDFQRIGTITNLESSVATATVPMLYRARIAWLMLLVFGNIFSGAGIAYFEDTIAAHLALMFFLPILIASGGNAGSQWRDRRYRERSRYCLGFLHAVASHACGSIL